MLRWFTGVTGAEQSSLARQTCSLSDGMVIALMPHISTTGVAKMASHAIFQYNVLVIDIDNTTLGLI